MNKSLNLYERAQKVIPDGLTASKAPRRFVGPGVISPTHIERGNGPWVWDVDGNRYLDMASALCPIILGYCDPEVNAAVQRQVTRGSLFTLPGQLEVEVAEELIEHWVPWAEMVRFVKTGSEACQAAVRLARGVTGRREILMMKGHYHGWHDWALVDSAPAAGIPKSWRSSFYKQEYGDVEVLAKTLELDGDQVAAVIMEPVGLEWPDKGYLEKVRDLCTKHDVLLIFDEIITGIRFNPTASAHFGVEPDLMILGKAIANGFPLAAVVGKREIMQHLNQEEVFVSGTYAGELISLAAAKATLERLRSKVYRDEYSGRGPFYELDRLWDWGERYMAMVSGLDIYGSISEHVKGYPVRFNLTLPDQLLVDLWQQECIKHGVLFTGAHNLSLAHCNDEVFGMLSRVYGEVAEVYQSVIKQAAGSTDTIEKWLDAPPTAPIVRRQR